MKKAIVALAIGGIMAASLTACAGAQSSSAPAAASSGSAAAVAASSTSTAAKDFDGAKYSDTGAGTMTLATSGGTSENGNVPQIAVKSSTSLMQIGLNYNGGDGTACTVYVDGVENCKLNAAERSQNSINLQGDALAPGVHTVEMVAMNGDAPSIYKKAQYEVVK